MSASENREKAQLVGNILSRHQVCLQLGHGPPASSSKRQLCITSKFLKFFFIADVQTNIEIGVKSGMFLYYLKNKCDNHCHWVEAGFICLCVLTWTHVTGEGSYRGHAPSLRDYPLERLWSERGWKFQGWQPFWWVLRRERKAAFVAEWQWPWLNAVC